MGLFKSIGKAFGVINPLSGFGMLDQLSGKSQQQDANKMALLSWQMANDYNNPIKQMERLKAAGLNPLLVYGSGSVTGNTTGAPSLQGGGISTPLESAFKGISNIMGVMQGKANLEQTKAAAQASTAAAGASSAQASNLNAQAALNETRNRFEEKSLIADLDYKRAQTRLANTQAKKTAAEADIAQGEADLFGAAGGAKGVQTVGKGLSTAARLLRGVMK